ncbi:MAG: hypothetical protein WA838_20510, partial [Xanthobacteraceae bacterium]
LSAGLSSADILADVRPPHELEHRFNVPPRLGILGLTFFLVAAGPLRGGNDGLLAIGVKQLSGIVVDFDFAHPHDIVLIVGSLIGILRDANSDNVQKFPLEHDPEKWAPVFRKDHAQTTS